MGSGGEGEEAAQNMQSAGMLLYPNTANQFRGNRLISVKSLLFKLKAGYGMLALAGDALKDREVTESSRGAE